MTDASAAKPYTIADLTDRLGLPADQQSTVAAWCGKGDVISLDGTWLPVFSEADLDLYVTLWTRA